MSKKSIRDCTQTGAGSTENVMSNNKKIIPSSFSFSGELGTNNRGRSEERREIIYEEINDENGNEN